MEFAMPDPGIPAGFSRWRAVVERVKLESVRQQRDGTVRIWGVCSTGPPGADVLSPLTLRVPVSAVVSAESAPCLGSTGETSGVWVLEGLAPTTMTRMPGRNGFEFLDFAAYTKVRPGEFPTVAKAELTAATLLAIARSLDMASYSSMRYGKQPAHRSGRIEKCLLGHLLRLAETNEAGVGEAAVAAIKRRGTDPEEVVDAAACIDEDSFKAYFGDAASRAHPAKALLSVWEQVERWYITTKVPYFPTSAVVRVYPKAVAALAESVKKHWFYYMVHKARVPRKLSQKEKERRRKARAESESGSGSGSGSKSGASFGTKFQPKSKSRSGTRSRSDGAPLAAVGKVVLVADGSESDDDEEDRLNRLEDMGNLSDAWVDVVDHGEDLEEGGEGDGDGEVRVIGDAATRAVAAARAQQDDLRKVMASLSISSSGQPMMSLPFLTRANVPTAVVTSLPFAATALELFGCMYARETGSAPGASGWGNGNSGHTIHSKAQIEHNLIASTRNDLDGAWRLLTETYPVVVDLGAAFPLNPALVGMVAFRNRLVLAQNLVSNIRSLFKRTCDFEENVQRARSRFGTNGSGDKGGDTDAGEEDKSGDEGGDEDEDNGTGAHKHKHKHKHARRSKHGKHRKGGSSVSKSRRAGKLVHACEPRFWSRSQATLQLIREATRRGITLEPEQLAAGVDCIVLMGVVVLDGMGGTGKTLVVSLVTAVLAPYCSTVTCAPTAKAGCNLADACGGMGWTMDAIRCCGDPEVPLGARGSKHSLVIDELSMASTSKLQGMMQKVVEYPGAVFHNIIVLGDNNQLPPISAGSPLADLIRTAAMFQGTAPPPSAASGHKHAHAGAGAGAHAGAHAGVGAGAWVGAIINPGAGAAGAGASATTNALPFDVRHHRLKKNHRAESRGIANACNEVAAGNWMQFLTMPPTMVLSRYPGVHIVRTAAPEDFYKARQAIEGDTVATATGGGKRLTLSSVAQHVLDSVAGPALGLMSRTSAGTTRCMFDPTRIRFLAWRNKTVIKLNKHLGRLHMLQTKGIPNAVVCNDNGKTVTLFKGAHYVWLKNKRDLGVYNGLSVVCNRVGYRRYNGSMEPVAPKHGVMAKYNYDLRAAPVIVYTKPTSNQFHNAGASVGTRAGAGSHSRNGSVSSSQESATASRNHNQKRKRGGYGSGSGNNSNDNSSDRGGGVPSDGGMVAFTKKMGSGLILPDYASTVNKNQGGQAECIVFILSAHVTQNLLYTGMSRAKKKLVIVEVSGAFRSVQPSKPRETVLFHMFHHAHPSAHMRMRTAFNSTHKNVPMALAPAPTPVPIPAPASAPVPIPAPVPTLASTSVDTTHERANNKDAPTSEAVYDIEQYGDSDSGSDSDE